MLSMSVYREPPEVAIMNNSKEKFILLIVLFLSTLSNINADLNKPQEQIKNKIKRITIASEPDYPPYCIIDEDGNAEGFSLDLFIAAAKAVNIEVDIKIGLWSQIKQDLVEGKIDALPLVGRTPERELLYDFTLAYISLHGAVFVREGTTSIKTLADLKDKEIVVMKDDNAEEFVRRNNISKNIFTTHTFENAFRALENGEHDAVITQQVMGLQLLKQLNIESIVTLDITLDNFKQDFCFGVKKGNKELLSSLNEGLSIVIANKTYDKIYLKWFGPNIKKELALEDIIRITLYILIPLIILFSIFSILFLQSEVKKRTFKLQKSEERFRAIFEQAAVGVALINTKTGKYVRINQKYCDFVGYSMQEMLTKTFMDLTYFEDVQINLDKNAQLIENSDKKFSFDKRYVHKDGTILWGNLTISPMWKSDKKPETYFHIAIVKDISERKREELIIQQQNIELHELNATKDKFFSIIAHDLRSPFQGFLSMTELMTENTGEFTSEELVQFINTINKSAKTLYKLLQNLLEWSQMQQGSMRFEQKVVNLSSLIAENLETIKERSIQKKIKIINEVTEPIKAYIDEKMMNSVLLNLFSNAIKFTHLNGTVTVKAIKSNKEMIEISVSDTGIGIQKSEIDKLFKVGEIIGSKGTEGELSTGLGLILCKEFVEKHGGKIRVESIEGKGSRFYFTVPVSN
jgi:PAS domain S-box-containing protein